MLLSTHLAPIVLCLPNKPKLASTLVCFPLPQNERNKFSVINSLDSPFVGRASDRRNGNDRRGRRTHPLRAVRFSGQRHRRGRRGSDSSEVYVDRYAPIWRYLSVGLLLLSALDGFLTLTLLPHGAEEINPLLRYFLSNEHLVSFVYVKLAATALGIVALVAHINFRWLRFIPVRFLIYGFFAGYFVLVQYELYLVWSYVGESAPAV